jgi:hypothetical protein
MSPTVQVADYFVAWLRNAVLGGAFMYIASRNYTSYKPFWFGFAGYFWLTSLVPGLDFCVHFYSPLRPYLEFVRFFSAWAGLIFAGIFISAIPSILSFLRRKRADGQLILEERNDKQRDMRMATGMLQSVMGLTSESNVRLRKKDDAAHLPA